MDNLSSAAVFHPVNKLRQPPYHRTFYRPSFRGALRIPLSNDSCLPFRAGKVTLSLLPATASTEVASVLKPEEMTSTNYISRNNPSIKVRASLSAPITSFKLHHMPQDRNSLQLLPSLPKYAAASLSRGVAQTDSQLSNPPIISPPIHLPSSQIHHLYFPHRQRQRADSAAEESASVE